MSAGCPASPPASRAVSDSPVAVPVSCVILPPPLWAACPACPYSLPQSLALRYLQGADATMGEAVVLASAELASAGRARVLVTGRRGRPEVPENSRFLQGSFAPVKEETT